MSLAIVITDQDESRDRVASIKIKIAQTEPQLEQTEPQLGLGPEGHMRPRSSAWLYMQ